MQINNKSIIKFLSGLTFLILLCPFFQTCSDESISELPKIKEQKDLRIKHNLILEARKENTINGYQISYLFIDESLFQKETIIDLTDFRDAAISICFSICIFLSAIVFYLSFKNNYFRIQNISIANLIVFLISIILIFFTQVFQDINQIKIGFYLLFLNLIAIVFFLEKN